MDVNGHITPLGEQYIGAVEPNVSSAYQPGVVHGGNGTTYNASGTTTDDAPGTSVHAATLLTITLATIGMLIVLL